MFEKPSTSVLLDGINSRILTEMTKGAVKEHLIQNASKMCDCSSVPEEIQCNMENRQNAEPIVMNAPSRWRRKEFESSRC